MINDILVSVIGLSLCLWMTFKTFIDFKKIFSKFEYLNKENEKINSWKKIKAKVLKKGFNLDYVYKNATFEEIEDYIDVEKEEFLIQQGDASYYKMTCNGPMIYYGYIVDGEKLYSRAIGLLPTEKDTELFYNTNVGDVINIYINDKDPLDTFIRKTSKEELDNLEWKNCKKLIPQFFFSIFIWILWLIGVYQFM